jgi:hypothetical protein
VLLVLTLLSPLLAIPALLLMERFERWTLTQPAGRLSEPWIRRRDVATPARGSGRRHATPTSVQRRRVLHGLARGSR